MGSNDIDDHVGFALLLAMTCGKADSDLVYDFAQACCRRGLVWVSTVGHGCELAHDLFDEAEVMLGIDEPGRSAEAPALTMWHTHDTPSQVLDFILTEAQPDDGEDGARAYRLLVVGDAESSEQFRAHLAARTLAFREI